MLTDIELKEKLIAKISSTDDVNLLQQISHLIDFEEEHEEIYKLNPNELAAVREGINQIESGLFLTNEQSDQLADECLGK